MATTVTIKRKTTPVASTDSTLVLDATKQPWRQAVWNDQTMLGWAQWGSGVAATNGVRLHPLVVDVWREEVMCGLTEKSAAQWARE